MLKIKRIIMGSLLAIGVLTNSVIPCYATTSITVDVTATRVYGKFVYDEPGHQLKIVVDYGEQNITTGSTARKYISAVKNGNETTVTASKYSESGYRYLAAKANGYVDNALVATSIEKTVN